jgi:glycosyltransferase involved in cell wall biosynthesis
MEYDNVIFNFIGFNFMDNSLIEYITKKHERIKISNYIPHDEVLKELLKSDVLMLMQSRVSIESYPGKMFEYIAAKKLVFLIGPENGNACDLLKEYKKFVRAEPENTDDIYLKIRYIIDNFDELDKIKPKRDFIDSYDRRYLTRKLVSIIEKTTI